MHACIIVNCDSPCRCGDQYGFLRQNTIPLAAQPSRDFNGLGDKHFQVNGIKPLFTSRPCLSYTTFDLSDLQALKVNSDHCPIRGSSSGQHQ